MRLRILRSLLVFIALTTVFMFATTAMADMIPKGNGKSVVMMKAPPADIGVISLIPKGDGVFVAMAPLATDPHGRGKDIFLTNVIPMTRGDTIGHYMITNSRPTFMILGARAYRTGFVLRT